MLYMTFGTLITWTANCVQVPAAQDRGAAGTDTVTSLIAQGGDGAISTDNYDEQRSSGFYGSVCGYGRGRVKLVWGTERDSWRNEVLATMQNNFLFWQRPLNLEGRQDSHSSSNFPKETGSSHGWLLETTLRVTLDIRGMAGVETGKKEMYLNHKTTALTWPENVGTILKY